MFMQIKVYSVKKYMYSILLKRFYHSGCHFRSEIISKIIYRGMKIANKLHKVSFIAEANYRATGILST